jgi:TRAP-type mannitol/chloroaromatic compound transport system substrate-binding protein
MIEDMSGGRLVGDVGGRHDRGRSKCSTPSTAAFDATHAWPGYWAGKNTAASRPRSGGPFGMDREEYLSWLFAGGGLELYNELLQKELKMNVFVPVFTTSLPYWEPLGWFKKPFASLDELRKMKFRTSGLGMEMMKGMGVSVVTLAGGEVVPALERGTVDGAEWAIPSHDILMGFQNVTKNYYMPDLPSARLLPGDHRQQGEVGRAAEGFQAIVKWAGMAEIIRMTAYSVDQDSKAIEELEKKHGVKVLRTPADVLKAQLPAIDKVYEAEAQKNPFFAKVLKSQKDFCRGRCPTPRRSGRPSSVVVPLLEELAPLPPDPSAGGGPPAEGSPGPPGRPQLPAKLC